MLTDEQLDAMEGLLARATPGEWGIWFEPIGGQADKAIQELVDQVHATDPIGNSLVMLDADGKCPAITGCGPTSAANAALIVALKNAAPTLIAAAREGVRLRRTAIDVAASLAAAISLLEKGGKAAKKAAPSDRMFDQMLVDYRASLERARTALNEGEK